MVFPLRDAPQSNQEQPPLSGSTILNRLQGKDISIVEMSFLITGDIPDVFKIPRFIDAAKLSGKPLHPTVVLKKPAKADAVPDGPKLSKKEAALRETKARVSASIAALVSDKPTVAKVREYMEARVKELCEA